MLFLMFVIEQSGELVQAEVEEGVENIVRDLEQKFDKATCPFDRYLFTTITYQQNWNRNRSGG